MKAPTKKDRLEIEIVEEWSVNCIKHHGRVETVVLTYVQYLDGSYDVLDASKLDSLLVGKYLRKFYRQSEERWIDVCRDPIRGSEGTYSGPERRQSMHGFRMPGCR
jgi:hypothetical protein